MELGTTFNTGVDWALALHARQSRKESTVPYAAHLLAVAATVLEAGGTEIEATAALLHDALEDTEGGDGVDPFTRDACVAKFGPTHGNEIFAIVDACSDRVPGTAPSERRDASTWERRKTAYLAELRDPGTPRSALLVSAADKLANVRSTLTDLAAGRGLAVWDASNAPEPKRAWQLWYQRSLVDAFQARLDGPLPGLLADAVAALARAAEVEFERGPGDFAPQFLCCSIGGYFGTSYSIVLDGQELVHEASEQGVILGSTRTTPTDDGWKRFAAALDAIGAWQWAGDYSPAEPVMDGTGWSVTILRDGRLVRAYGSNGYPPIGEVETRPTFHRFCTALEALTGADFR